jgi:hypothetical protein
VATRRPKISDNPEPGRVTEEKIPDTDSHFPLMYPMYVFYEDDTSSYLEGHLAPRSLDEAQKIARSLMRIRPGFKNIRRIHIYESRGVYRFLRGK